jgi:hypothetical protein
LLRSRHSFYNKAKAFDSLSGFYESCSQVEIDEYRDYEKALSALKESLKQMGKARSVNKEAREKQLHHKVRACVRSTFPVLDGAQSMSCVPCNQCVVQLTAHVMSAAAAGLSRRTLRGGAAGGQERSE